MDTATPVVAEEMETERNLSLHTGLERFLRIVRGWGGPTRYYKRSAFGLRRGEAATVLQARLILSPVPFEEAAPTPLDAKPFWATTEIGECSSKDLVNLIREVAKGRLTMSNFAADLPIDESRPPTMMYFPTSPPSVAVDPGDARVPALFISGEPRASLLSRVLEYETLEWRLRASDPPFADLDDIYSYFGLPALAQAGDLSLIEVWLRPPVVIEQRSAFDGTTAIAYLSAAKSLDRKKVVLGYRGFGGSQGVVRGRIYNTAASWTMKENSLQGEFRIDVGDTATVQFFLTYDSIAVQQWWIANPAHHGSARYALHAAFDPNLALLKRLALDTKSAGSRDFEDGVAILLNLLGFSVTQYGRLSQPPLGPDILAWTPRGQILVVQCTDGLPNQDGQVDNVSRFAEAARLAATAAGSPGMRVIPAVVTALPEDDLLGHRDEAARRGVAVAAFETVFQAFDEARNPGSPDVLFDRLAEHLALMSRPNK